MKNPKLYFIEESKHFLGYAILLFCVGLIQIVCGLIILDKHGVYLVLIGTAMAGYALLYWLYKKRLLFTQFVNFIDGQLEVKSSVFKKAWQLKWSDVEVIDLSHFEPVLRLKNERSIMLKMVFDQTVLLRSMLRAAAAENLVPVIEEDCPCGENHMSV